MVKCHYCSNEISFLPYTCKLCNGKFCQDHRLPENHECEDLPKKKINYSFLIEGLIKEGQKYEEDRNYAKSFECYSSAYRMAVDNKLKLDNEFWENIDEPLNDISLILLRELMEEKTIDKIWFNKDDISSALPALKFCAELMRFVIEFKSELLKSEKIEENIVDLSEKTKKLCDETEKMTNRLVKPSANAYNEEKEKIRIKLRNPKPFAPLENKIERIKQDNNLKNKNIELILEKLSSGSLKADNLNNIETLMMVFFYQSNQLAEEALELEEIQKFDEAMLKYHMARDTLLDFRDSFGNKISNEIIDSKLSNYTDKIKDLTPKISRREALLIEEILSERKNKVMVNKKVLDSHRIETAALEKAKSGDYKGAIDLIKKAVETNPKKISLYVGIVECYKAIENHDEVINWCRKGIKIKSDPFEFYNWLGEAKISLGSYEEGINYANLAINLKNNTILEESYLVLANGQKGMGKYIEAMVSYKKALEICSGHPFCLFGIGECLESLGRIDDAIQFFKKAAEIYPENKIMSNKLKDVEYKTNLLNSKNENMDNTSKNTNFEPNSNNMTENDKEEKVSEIDINVDDTNISFLVDAREKLKGKNVNLIDVKNLENQALEMIKSGQFGRAIDLIIKAHKISPNRLAEYIGIIACYEKLGDFESIVRWCKKALNSNLNKILYYNWMSEAYIELEKYEEAIQYVNNAIISENNTKQDESYYILGKIYKKLKDFSKSIENFNKSIENNPEHIDSWFELGNSYQQIGKENEALQAFKKAENLTNQKERKNCEDNLNNSKKMELYFEMISNRESDTKMGLENNRSKQKELTEIANKFLENGKLMEKHSKYSRAGMNYLETVKTLMVLVEVLENNDKISSIIDEIDNYLLKVKRLKKKVTENITREEIESYPEFESVREYARMAFEANNSQNITEAKKYNQKAEKVVMDLLKKTKNPRTAKKLSKKIERDFGDLDETCKKWDSIKEKINRSCSSTKFTREHSLNVKINAEKPTDIFKKRKDNIHTDGVYYHYGRTHFEIIKFERNGDCYIINSDVPPYMAYKSRISRNLVEPVGKYKLFGNKGEIDREGKITCKVQFYSDLLLYEANCCEPCKRGKIFKFYYIPEADDNLKISPIEYEIDEFYNNIISEHFSSYLGEKGIVLHEDDSTIHSIFPSNDDFHLDIHIYPPTETRKNYVIITGGMSSIPMNTNEIFNDFRFCELMITMPSNWNPPMSCEIHNYNSDDKRKMTDMKIIWPIQYLKLLARYPNTFKTWLSPTHTVEIPREAMRSYIPNSDLNSVIILPLSDKNFKFSRFDIGSKRVNIYQIFPVYDVELGIATSISSCYLMKFFKMFGIEMEINIHRKDRISKLLGVSSSRSDIFNNFNNYLKKLEVELEKISNEDNIKKRAIIYRIILCMEIAHDYYDNPNQTESYKEKLRDLLVEYDRLC